MYPGRHDQRPIEVFPVRIAVTQTNDGGTTGVGDGSRVAKAS